MGFRFWLLALQQSHSSSSDGVAEVGLLQYCCFGGVVVVHIMEWDHVIRLKWLCWDSVGSWAEPLVWEPSSMPSALVPWST